LKQNSIDTSIFPFTLRFVVVHVVTYTVFGIIFMSFSNYFSFFASDPILNAVMKPANALSVKLAVPAQIIRGALLGLAIYPFRVVVFEKRFGWLKLFWLMFVLTGIGAVITGPGSIEGFLYTKFPFNPLVGLPEITVQMLAFSWIFCRWQRKEQPTG